MKLDLMSAWKPFANAFVCTKLVLELILIIGPQVTVPVKVDVPETASVLLSVVALDTLSVLLSVVALDTLSVLPSVVAPDTFSVLLRVVAPVTSIPPELTVSLPFSVEFAVEEEEPTVSAPYNIVGS